VELSVADFEAAGLGSQLSAIEDGIGRHLEGNQANVAVVAEPYAGRDVLLSHAEEQFGAASGHVTFEELVTDQASFEFPNKEVVFVEGCHYLYARRIGGFDVLDAFLQRIAASDSVFVTAWNHWAWDYLAAVRDVDHAFPVKVPVPRLEMEAIRSLVREHVEELPTFVESDAYGRMKTVDFSRERVGSVGDVALALPVPRFNLEYLTAIGADESISDVERVVFERLTRLSEGNPGVALSLWHDAVEDGEIAASHFDEETEPLDLDDDEAFVLATVLSNERLAVTALESMLEEIPVAQAIQTLGHQSLVTSEDGVVAVAPDRFRDAVNYLEGRRFLW
jgi:hypothetical protein